MAKATVTNDMFTFAPANGWNLQEIFAKDIERTPRGERNQDKTLAGVYILKIVEKSATPENPISQTKIIKILQDRYGIEIGRAAVGRIIHALADSPFGICYNRRGVWFAEDEVWEV